MRLLSGLCALGFVLGLVIGGAVVGVGLLEGDFMVQHFGTEMFIRVWCVGLMIAALLVALGPLGVVLGLNRHMPNMSKKRRDYHSLVAILFFLFWIPAAVLATRLLARIGMNIVFSQYFHSDVRMLRHPAEALSPFWSAWLMGPSHFWGWALFAGFACVVLLWVSFVRHGAIEVEDAKPKRKRISEADLDPRPEDSLQTAELNAIGSAAYQLGVGHEGGGVVMRKP